MQKLFNQASVLQEELLLVIWCNSGRCVEDLSVPSSFLKNLNSILEYRCILFYSTIVLLINV